MGIQIGQMTSLLAKFLHKFFSLYFMIEIKKDRNTLIILKQVFIFEKKNEKFPFLLDGVYIGVIEGF